MGHSKGMVQVLICLISYFKKLYFCELFSLKWLVAVEKPFGKLKWRLPLRKFKPSHFYISQLDLIILVSLIDSILRGSASWASFGKMTQLKWIEINWPRNSHWKEDVGNTCI